MKNDQNELFRLYSESVGLGPKAEGVGPSQAIHTQIKQAEQHPHATGDCDCEDSDPEKCPECEEDSKSVKAQLKKINDIVRTMYREVDDADESKLEKLKEIKNSLKELSTAAELLSEPEGEITVPTGKDLLAPSSPSEM